MSNKSSFLNSVSNVIQTGVNHGILHLYTDEAHISGMEFSMNGKSLQNFGSCSYLGLEFHPEMKKSAIRAVEKYGTQFSSSRAYVSVGLYKQLEQKFEQIFEKPVVIAQTTSLAHIAALPVLVGEQDAVILDHQVHNSVQTAASMLKAKNIPVEMIRHNRMDMLEERIAELRKTKKKIWYLCDGIYSMYGDTAPVEELKTLLKKYPELWIYADDAHGMSCFGKNGRGFILDNFFNEQRLITAVSLAKAFATGGSVLVFPDKELASSVRNCGGPLITSGPLQPATLGAAIASADIHLSPEFSELQNDLHENILYTNLLIKKLGLPIVFESNTPVFYIAAGTPKLAYTILQKMMRQGYYLNLGAFPAVPMKNSGIRFTITASHTMVQIHDMLSLLAEVYPVALMEERTTIDEIGKAFKMNFPSIKVPEQEAGSLSQIHEELFTCFDQLPGMEWDEIMEQRGIFGMKGLQFLEKVFRNAKEEENRWVFDYYVIRDENNRIVLCTFFTTAWMKGDMLSSKGISSKLEEIRKDTGDIFYGSEKVLMTGSLLSEGEHLFIDKNSKHADDALKMFYKHVEKLMERRGAGSVLLRDFTSGNESLEKTMNENGYFSYPMPDSYSVSLTNISNEEDFLNSLSANAKKNLRKEVLRYRDLFTREVISKPDDELLREIYALYLEVKNSNLELNTYTLPKDLFRAMCEDENWEFILIYKNEGQNEKSLPVAVIMAFKGHDIYHPMLAGVRKNLNLTSSPYRRALYELAVHAISEKYSRINLGFSAGMEKKKIGATATACVSYMQSKDNFTMESMMYQPLSKNKASA